MTEEPGPRSLTLALFRMLKLFNRASHIGILHLPRLGLAYTILSAPDSDQSYTLRTILATHDTVRRLNLIRAYSITSHRMQVRSENGRERRWPYGIRAHRNIWASSDLMQIRDQYTLD